jgi:hypothetical protein
MPDDLWREENATTILKCHGYRPNFDNTKTFDTCYRPANINRLKF